MHRHLLPILLVGALGCSSDGLEGEVCDIADPVANVAGATHAVGCASDSECLFGRCHLNPAIASFGFCTKRCDCPSSACSDEDSHGHSYFCQRFAPALGEPAVCTEECETVADCPAGYTGCEVVTGTQKVCVDL